MSKVLFYSLIVTGVKHVPYNDKKTNEPKLMCTCSALGGSVIDARVVGRGAIDMDLSQENNGEVALRLQADLKQAISQGYEFIHITPYQKYEARSRGEGKSVICDYDLVGYSSMSSVAIDDKRPSGDVKQNETKQPESKQPVKS
ncbi:hypothetical protein GJM11_25465 [Salmonella enterica]|nr:hypothetical protein [Salmonella enterica]EEL6611822.1 hypothetical protein [Salmonella enterica]EFO5310538.1 hypothetical protein [Salmonella enterica]EFO8059042.1 hypothetical protein [Salmonella enterica]EFP3557672.1 hypothetical protein [Salmonella enterica]